MYVLLFITELVASLKEYVCVYVLLFITELQHLNNLYVFYSFNICNVMNNKTDIYFHGDLLVNLMVNLWSSGHQTTNREEITSLHIAIHWTNCWKSR